MQATRALLAARATRSQALRSGQVTRGSRVCGPQERVKEHEAAKADLMGAACRTRSTQLKRDGTYCA